jgi:hypothetical protein
MPHPLVDQLRFSRSEFIRCLDEISEADAKKCLEPMNCISWIIGHLANQEHTYWVIMGQGRDIAPGLNDVVGHGKPASTPPLAEMWSIWHEVTTAADDYLDTLNPDLLQQKLEWVGARRVETLGTMLLRNIYHYWFHIGEAHAIRQQLGHKDLPHFVGNMEQAFYRPERN